jgi:hypothetical protein
VVASIFAFDSEAGLPEAGCEVLMVDVISIAAAAVSLIAPVLHYLRDGVKVASETVEQVEKARGVWDKIKSLFQADPKLKAQAEVVAADPKDADNTKKLTTELAKRLEARPEFARELEALLGGGKAIQEFRVRNNAYVENLKQSMASPGVQTIEAGDDFVGKGISQSQGLGASGGAQNS